MEKTSTLITNVFNNGREYLQLKSKSLQLEVYDKVSGLVAGMANGLMIAVLSIFALLFVNVGLGFALSVAFKSHVWGFLALGGIYIVLLGIYMAVRNTVDLKIRDTVVGKLSDDRYSEYDKMMKDRKQLNAELERSETLVKGNAEELKENVEILAEDFKKLKEDIQRFRHLFSFGDQKQEEPKKGMQQEEATTGAKDFKKMAVSTIAELIINRLVMKDVHSIKQLIWPTIAKVLVNAGITADKSTDQHKGESSGFLSSLKDKLAKFL